MMRQVLYNYFLFKKIKKKREKKLVCDSSGDGYQCFTSSALFVKIFLKSIALQQLVDFIFYKMYEASLQAITHKLYIFVSCSVQ